MRDLWATIGACCIDKDLRKAIGKELRKGTPDLQKIQKLLRKQCGINLSRWELEEIQRLYTQYAGGSKKQSVLDMMEKAGYFMPMSVAAEDRELCAAIGLACIDEGYRQKLYKACVKGDPNRTADLTELLQEDEDGPRFKGLGQPDLQRLNRVMARGKKHDGNEVKDWMKSVQTTGWESPTGYSVPGTGTIYPACSVGYTFDARPYLHVSQPKLAKVLGVPIKVKGKKKTLQQFLEDEGVLS